MKRPLAVAALAALLFVALFFANYWRQRNAVYILSRYPQTGYFQWIVSSHLHPSDEMDTLVYYETHFGENKLFLSATDWRVESSGKHYCTANSELSAWVDSASIGVFSPSQLATFQNILHDMPRSQSRPAPQDLLIVSFRQNARWQTRIYDRSHLPLAVVKTHKMLGIKGFDQLTTNANR